MATPMEVLMTKKEQAMKNISDNGYFSKKRVYIGMATCEIAAGSKEVWSVFESARNEGVDIYLSTKGCAGRCSVEPTVEVIDQDGRTSLYCKINVEGAKRIVEEHLKGNIPVQEFIGE